MDAAEELVLEQGFAGTSVDAIIGQAGVTKGAFFYHFDSKQDLAHALIGRFVELDLGHLEENMTRATRLQKEPLQQLLLFVGLFIEEAEELTQPVPGCLMGSYIYEAGLFDDQILEMVSDNMMRWREVLVAKFDEVAEAHPPSLKVDTDSLADMMTVIFEGAFVVSRSLREPAVVAEQLTHYRNYLELLFVDAP